MKVKNKKRWQGIKFLIIVFFACILISELVTSFFISTIMVTSGSMAPNIQAGERRIVNHLYYGMTVPFTSISIPQIRPPDYGEVVIIRRSEKIPILSDLIGLFTFNRRFGNVLRTSEQIPRRVIALPGDTVYLDSGLAYLQIKNTAQFISEFELNSNSYALKLPSENFNTPDHLPNYFSSEITVPEGSIFVLPDNRSEFFGSVSWGEIDLAQIVGQVLEFR